MKSKGHFWLFGGFPDIYRPNRPPRCLFCAAIPLRSIIAQTNQRSGLPVKHDIMPHENQRKKGSWYLERLWN